jgi:UDP-glucose 4-epimerase
LNILVTGGCGFIGSHIVGHNLALGHRVHAVDNLSSGSLKNVADFKDNTCFSCTEADILSWDGLADAVQWADCIYHMAAITGVYKVLADPISVINTNMAGCEHLFETIGRVGNKPRVMVASSSMIYGDSMEPLLSETDPLIIKSTAQGHWSYAVSKLANESLTVFGDGTQTRSFCDVRDTVHGMQLLASSENCIGECVNIGNDKEISILNLAHLVRDRAGSHSKIINISYQDAYGEIFVDIMMRRPNLNKLMQMTGFKPERRLEDTIDNLIADFRTSA